MTDENMLLYAGVGAHTSSSLAGSGAGGEIAGKDSNSFFVSTMISLRGFSSRKGACLPARVTLHTVRSAAGYETIISQHHNFLPWGIVIWLGFIRLRSVTPTSSNTCINTYRDNGTHANPHVLLAPQPLTFADEML